jgi:hypothetical protein
MSLCKFCGETEAKSLVLGEGDFDPKEGISKLPTGLTPIDEIGWPEYLDQMDQGCDDEEACPYKAITHWHISEYCCVEHIGYQTDILHGIRKND